MIKILLVDDCRDDYEIAARKLERIESSLEVVWAESAAQAFKKLKEEDFDCILCDYQMPRMNGLQFLKKLRKQDDHTPFIFLTGQGNEEIAAEALRLGADDYFTKEVGFAHYQRLLNSIRRVVDAHTRRVRQKEAEVALKESEREKTIILEGLSELVTFQDTELLVKWANQAAGDSVGQTPEELVGRYCYEIWHQRTEVCVGCPVVRCMKSGTIEANESTSPDGRVWFIRGNPVFDEKGKIIGAVETTLEITERKKAEEALRESEHKFRQFFENAPESCYMISTDGIILDINRSAREALGYGREEIVGKRFIDTVYAPASRERARQLFKQWKGKGRLDNEEMTIITKAGEERTILLSVDAVRDAEGNIIHSISVQRDITDRKRAVEEIRNQAAFVVNNPAPVLQATYDGKIVRFNPATRQVFKEDLEARSIFELLPTLGKAAIRRLTSAKPHTFEHVSDGQAFLFVIRKDIKTKSLFIYGTDISERKRAEDALKQSEEQFKAQFKSMPIPTYTWQKSGDDFVLVDYNDAAIEITGGKVAKYVGAKAGDMYRDQPDIREELWRCLEKKKPIEREMVYRYSSGRFRFLNVKYAFVPPDFVLVHTEDISKRKQAEEEVRGSEEKFRELFHNINDAIYLWEMKEDGTLGMCLEVNDVACKLSEYSRDEILKQSPPDINEEEFLERLPGLLRKLSKYKHVMFRNILITKSGKRIPVEVNNHLFKLKGRDVILSVTRDVSERVEMERDLRFIQFAVEHSSEAAFWMNSDGRIIYVNEAACRQLGYSRDELLSMTIHDIDAELTEEQWSKEWKRVKKKQSAFQESFLITKEGEAIPVELSAGYVEFEGSEFCCAFARNITERRKAEASKNVVQKISEASQTAKDLDELYVEIHRALGEMFPIENFYIALHDSETNMLSFPYFVDQFEEAPEPYPLGKGVTEYVLRTGESLLGTPEVVESLEKAGEVELVGPPSLDWLGVPLKTQDRTIGVLVVQTYREGVRYGAEEKRILEFVSTQVAMAIERKRAEEELRRTIEKLKGLESIIGRSPAMAFMWKVEEGRPVEYVSDNVKQVLGYSAEEFESGEVSWPGITYPADYGRLEEEVGDFLRQGIREFSQEYRLVAKSGEIRWMRDRKRVLYDAEERPAHIQSVVIDITDRKRAEDESRISHEQLEQRTAELEAVNRELEAFSYSVSHDLRTPLRHIKGYGRMLLDRCGDVLDEQGGHYVRRMMAGTERMTELIGNLLKLSRISQQEVKRRSVSLSALARDIAGELRREHGGRRVSFEIGDRIVADADEPLIRTALENLLRNAWKFTGLEPEGRIEFGTEVTEGEEVYFVRDNGVGFNPESAEMLFAPFQRLHEEEEFEGTGVGLATVQRIVHRHGGKVWAEGKEGEGATFYFTLG